MSTDIKKFLALQTALVNEKARIEARLSEISKVLGQSASSESSTPVPTGGKRKFSEATKAKMRASQQARWAKIKGRAAKPASAAPKKKRKLSAEGRAAIVAASKARWAKVNAAKKNGKSPPSN